MRVKWPASKGGAKGEAATELGRIVSGEPPYDPGQFVRALSRAVVHVPMPGAPRESHPRAAGPDDGGPPLLVVTDEDGQHALVYSSPAALVEAWKKQGQVTAAAVPMATLLAGWPADVDLVIDAGLPQAYQVSEQTLEIVAMDAAGVPTADALRPSPEGWDTLVPDPEPAQIIGVTRELADTMPEITALWRGVTRDHEPLARDVLNLVVELVPGTPDERVGEIMNVMIEATGELDPQPLRLLADLGEPSPNARLIQDVKAVDDPFWSRGQP